MKQNLKLRQSGFSLLELLIALIVFSVGILGVYSMQTSAVFGNTKSRIVSEASLSGSDFIETIISWDYDHPALIDDDDGKDSTDNDSDLDAGDGTNKDLNYDGIDDSGNSFGLDDKANPDGQASENGFTVYWNVANDVPLPDTKTIRVIVEAPQRANDVSFTFVKYHVSD